MCINNVNLGYSDQKITGNSMQISVMEGHEFDPSVLFGVGTMNPETNSAIIYIVSLLYGVSENSGTPKSSILIGFSIINHPFWGNPYFWKHPYRSTHFGDRFLLGSTQNVKMFRSEKGALSTQNEGFPLQHMYHFLNSLYRRRYYVKINLRHMSSDQNPLQHFSILVGS